MNPEFYERQYSPWSLVIGIIVLIQLGLPFLIPLPAAVTWTIYAAAVFVSLTGFAFAELTTQDNGESLSVQFGPLPVARMKLSYADIKEIQRERSTVIDGWGLHWVRGGWLWNLWGFDCIKIVTNQKTVRIGTQKPDEFFEFLLLKAGKQLPDSNF